MKKFQIIIIMLLGCIGTHFAQEPEKSIYLYGNHNGAGNKKYIARDDIRFNGEFHFNASLGEDFEGIIDPSLVFNTSYLLNSLVVNAETRVLDTELAVGGITGTPDISASGAATYTIPVDVPEGTAGIQPNLALNYNSQSGSGTLGMGWSLSGMSAISRVPKTIATNNAVGGIYYNLNDVYALDGNRLLATNYDVYGAEGTGYETEVKTHSKIESFGKIEVAVPVTGTVNTGPEWFRVTTRDGKIIEYGNSEDSRATPQNSSAPLLWLINKIQDPNGNYMTFKYKKHNGETVVEQIDYTGNVGSEPYNSIVFLYQEKKEKKTVYAGGNDMTANSMGNGLSLREIRLSYNDYIIKTYTFEYFKGLNNKSYLNTVTLNGPNGEKLNPIVINYGNVPTTLSTKVTTVNNADRIKPASDKTWTAGDVNGDGITDLIASYDYLRSVGGINLPSKKFDTYLSNPSLNGNLSFEYSSNSYESALPSEWVIRDYLRGSGRGGLEVRNINGDNEPDIVAPFFLNMPDNQQNEFQFFVLNEDPVSPQLVYFLHHSQTEIPPYAMGDINNDGIDEIIVLTEKTNTSTLEYEGTVCYPNVNASDGNLNRWKYLGLDLGIYAPDHMYLSDYNGDGLLDILVIHGDDHSFLINQGGEMGPDGFVEVSFEKRSTGNNLGYEPDFIRPGDFNGDGFLDLLLVKNNNWKQALFNGSGFDVSTITAFDFDPGAGDALVDDCIITDFNNDGKSDVIISDAAISYLNREIVRFYWFESYEDGFSQEFQVVSEDAEYYTHDRRPAQGDFNGDGYMDMLTFGYNIKDDIIRDNKFRTYDHFNSGFNTSLVTTIADGYNSKVNFTYQPLTYKDDPENTDPFYTSVGVNEIYPLKTIKAPIYCVRKISSSNGLGGMNSLSMSYDAASVHVTGKGFLGFSGKTVTDNTAGVKTISSRTLDGNYMTSKSTVEKKTTGNSPISKVVSDFSNSKTNDVYTVRLTSSVSNDYLTNTQLTTTYGYDASNDMLSSVLADYGNGYWKQTTYSDFVAAGSWTINKAQRVTVTSKHPDDPITFSKTTKFEYASTIGSLHKKTENFGVAGKEVETIFTNFDKWGNPQRVQINADSEGGNLLRYSTYEYDPTGRKLKLEENELGSVTYDYDPITGLLVSKTNNQTGLQTNYTFDNLFRLTRTDLSDGNSIHQEFGWAKGNGPTNALFYEYTTTEGKPWVKKWYDKLGRVLREETIGFNNVSFYADTRYNNQGQVEESVSYANGALTNKVNYTYYAGNGRLKNKTFNTGRLEEYNYTGKSVEVTSHGITKTQTYDVWGNLDQVVENTTGGTINYTYYSHGQPNTIQTQASAISVTYDNLGYKKTLIDPDAGTIEYRHDGLGRLTYQKDAKANESYMFYDGLGMLDRKTLNGNETNYDYFKDGAAKGLLQKEVAPNGSFKEYGYDIYGRIIKTTEHIDETINDIVFEYKYDDKGNNYQINYPDNFSVNRTFDANGFLTEVKSGSDIIWKLNELTTSKMRYTLGNGHVTEKNYNSHGMLSSILTSKGSIHAQSDYYDFDPLTGMLKSREDRRSGYNLKESFIYDGLFRLTDWDISKNNIVTHSYDQTYKSDYSGNINTKSGIGTFKYDGTSGPHAVDSVLSITGSPISQDPQNIDYTDFNKVDVINQSNKSLSFNYGPDELRTKTELKVNSTLEQTHYYAGLYEKKVINGGSTTEYFYIPAGDGIAAVLIKTDGGTGTLHYLHKDHLGSLTCITDQAGAIKEEFSYDPWGRRRSPTDWSFNSVPQPTLMTRGFTGHEHLDDFDIINMNGRIYDPMLGMFLSPDKYMPALNATQGLNRYSYGFNNPMMYTDPDGNNPLLIAGVFIFSAGFHMNNYGHIYNKPGLQVAGQYMMVGGSILTGFGGGAAGVITSAYMGGFQDALNGGSFEKSFLRSIASSVALAGLGKIGNIPWVDKASNPAIKRKYRRISTIGDRLGIGLGGADLSNVSGSVNTISATSRVMGYSPGQGNNQQGGRDYISESPYYYELSPFSKSGLHATFTSAEGVGMNGGYFYKLYGKLVQNDKGVSYIYASASAWAPSAEKHADFITYYASITVFDNGKELYSGNLQVWNPNEPMFTQKNFTYIGDGYMPLPVTGNNISVEISITYNMYQWWNGSAVPSNPYTHTINF